MNNRISRVLAFEFIRSSGAVIAVVNEQHVAKLNDFGICPADQVPEGDDSYLSFVGRTAKDPLALLERTRAALVILDGDIPLPDTPSSCIVQVKNARLFVCELLSFLESARIPKISESAVIDPSAMVGVGTAVGDFACISAGVVLGTDCTIGSHVSILDNVVLGNRVTVAPGTVIGKDGFGYEQREDGSYIRFPHIGGVRIGSDVEIGSNSVIDRGSLGMTIIEDGVKIDNLVHIAHNVHIAANALIIANAMIAGGAKVGPGCWIGPSSNLLDRVTVGSKVFVGLGVSVVKDLPDNSRFTLKHFLRSFS